MALTNAEKQSRWRERHIIKRRNAQRLANLLMRKTYSVDHIAEMAFLLRGFMNSENVRTLRRKLRGRTQEEMDAIWREHEKAGCDLWLSEHPGRTAAQYRRMLGNNNSEVWRRAKGAAINAAER